MAAAVYDIATTTRMLNAVFGRVEGGKLIPNRVSVETARRLVALGQRAIAEARRVGANVPGGSARDQVFWKLEWHYKTTSAMQPEADYAAHAADLREWVTRAVVEFNAAADAAAYADKITFLGEVSRELEALAPKLALGLGLGVGGGVALALLVLVGFLVVSRAARG